MARAPKPEPSEELLYLRTVMSQHHDADDPNDVKLKNYRRLHNEDQKWVFTQKLNLEEKYAATLAAWKKEGKKESAKTEEEAPLEPCEVLVQRLITEWKE